MITTFISTVLGSATAGSFAYALFLTNDYVFHSGTRVPTGFDYLVVFGLVVLSVVGAIAGFMLGQAFHTEKKTASVFLTSPYIFIPLALVILLGIIFVLSTAITKRDSTPAPQNTALIQTLEGTMWTRDAHESEIKELSFVKTVDSACVGGRVYVITYNSGNREEGCWSIGAGTDTLRLSNSKLTSIYQNLTVSADNLSLTYGAQTWRFIRRNN